MRIDASAHGFFTMFPELRAIERGVTYIPVRLEETTLLKPNAVPERALIEIISKNERSIVANSFIFNGKDELIAVLRGVRCQAISTRRASSVEAVSFVELSREIDGTILGQTGIAGKASDIAAAAASLGLSQNGETPTESEMLIEGWATAAAYEIASALADDDTIDVEGLVGAGTASGSFAALAEQYSAQSRGGRACQARRRGVDPDRRSVIAKLGLGCEGAGNRAAIARG